MGSEPIDQGPVGADDDSQWYGDAEPVPGDDQDVVLGAPLPDEVRKKKKTSDWDPPRQRSGCNLPLMLVGGCMMVCVLCCCLPLCASAVAFGGLAAAISDSEATDSGSTTIPVPANSTITLSVDNPVGEITIERGPVGQVEVAYTKRTYSFSYSMAENRLSDIDVQVTQPGGDDTVDVTVDMQHEGNSLVDLFSFADNVSLTITVPESVDLAINSNVGAISVRDITAESLDIQTNTGAVEFYGQLGGNINATYRIKTNTGAISVTLPRDVYVAIDATTDVGAVDLRTDEFDTVGDYQSQQDVVGETWIGTLGTGDEDPPSLTLRSDTGAIMIEGR